MISFNPSVPDVPATLQTLSDMLALLSDPAASTARVAELQAATAALQKATEESKAERATFALVEQKHKAALDQQSTDAAEELAANQAAFDTEYQRRSQELDDREVKLTALQAKAQADADEAEKLRKDLQRRLSAVKAAMA